MEKSIVSTTKEKTIDFLRRNINGQALLFTRQKCQNVINQISNKFVTSILGYVGNLNSISLETNAMDVYNSVLNELQRIVDEADYLEALRVINNLRAKYMVGKLRQIRAEYGILGGFSFMIKVLFICHGKMSPK